MGPRQADLVLDLLRESARVVIAETSAAGGAIGRFQPSRVPGDLVDQHQQGGQIGRIGELAQLGEAQVRWCAGHGLRPPSWLLGPAITCRYRRTRAITPSRAQRSDGTHRHHQRATTCPNAVCSPQPLQHTNGTPEKSTVVLTIQSVAVTRRFYAI